MTNDDENVENLFDYSTRLQERSNNRIARIGRILKKKQTSGEEETNKRRGLPRPATYVSTFVSRERSTPSKSITSDDVPLAMLRNA